MGLLPAPVAVRGGQAWWGERDLFSLPEAQRRALRGGEMAMISDASEKARHLWWSEDGGRVYDGIAQTVCNVAAEYANGNIWLNRSTFLRTQAAKDDARR